MNDREEGTSHSTRFRKSILLVALGVGAGMGLGYALDKHPPFPSLIPPQTLGPAAACWVILVSVVTFIMFVVDKLKAKFAAWRISENTLYFLAALGGTPGALVAMTFAHHKTRKFSFKFWFFIIAVIQAGAFLLLAALGHTR